MKLKILSLLVAMLAVVMLFASCGGGGDDPADPGTTPGGQTGGSNEIIVQLYENDNKGELSSGLKRYYAGEDKSFSDPIDELVKDRNTAAETETGVDAKYFYTGDFAWGQSFNDVQGKVNSGASTAPDVYCNFAYDLTSLALRGYFANLLTTSVNGAAVTNHFRFTESDYNPSSSNYFDSAAGEGYFFDYMKSLAFANSNGKYDKMYCLASDYTIDVLRAFLVMPVNVQIMNELGSGANDYATDRDNDGDFDINDFYDLVWDGEWTYDVLAAFANSANVPGTGDNANTDMTDTRIGAAFGKSSGLTAAGLLYTSSVQIIDRNVATGSYAYLATNQDLIDFATALENLFKENEANGICSATTGDMQSAGLIQSAASQGDIAGIRVKFAQGGVLFGGIIALGSVESTEFQGLNSTTGFGLVPVPVYKAGDEYLTLVHNIARIVAISKTTTEFEQCTKFLNYQSTNSAEIIETYYSSQLAAAVSGNANNAKMLTYIRNHVRDCFDKTYEDVISSYMSSNGDEEADTNKWHILLRNADYKYANIGNDYNEIYTVKQGHLTTILGVWAGLSN